MDPDSATQMNSILILNQAASVSKILGCSGQDYYSKVVNATLIFLMSNYTGDALLKQIFVFNLCYK